jgi:hypothetical protein
MTDLSQAAKAVRDAYEGEDTYNFPLDGIAAALRAATDEVVPLSYEDVWTDGKILQYEKHDPVREKLLAIAAELESND